MDDFAQELKKLFKKVYAGILCEGPEADVMGQTELANQFVAGLRGDKITKSLFDSAKLLTQKSYTYIHTYIHNITYLLLLVEILQGLAVFTAARTVHLHRGREVPPHLSVNRTTYHLLFPIQTIVRLQHGCVQTHSHIPHTLTCTMPAMCEEKVSLYMTFPVCMLRTSTFPLDQPVTSSGTPSSFMSKACITMGWLLD